MNRRSFLAASSAFALMPMTARAADFVTFEPGVIQSALSAGETVFLDYSATWCGTCKRQARVIDALRTENPAYDAAMTFIKVDWDTYKSHPVTRDRGIPRRSTLLVLRGNEELGRVIAGTSQGQIKALMDLGL